MLSLIHILAGESDNHQFFMLRTWFFFIKQASTIPIFTGKGAKITEILGLSQSSGHLGFGVPLKKSKIVISTFLGILGQNKSKNFFGHVTWLSVIPNNHFGWRHPGYRHARGLIDTHLAWSGLYL